MKFKFQLRNEIGRQFIRAPDDIEFISAKVEGGAIALKGRGSKNRALLDIAVDIDHVGNEVAFEIKHRKSWKRVLRTSPQRAIDRSMQLLKKGAAWTWLALSIITLFAAPLLGIVMLWIYFFVKDQIDPPIGEHEY